MAPCKSFPFHSSTWSPAKTPEKFQSFMPLLSVMLLRNTHKARLKHMQPTFNFYLKVCVCTCVFIPGLRCPTVSARLPFRTLVMKAQSLPDSVILPPTTCRSREVTELASLALEWLVELQVFIIKLAKIPHALQLAEDNRFSSWL